MRASVSQPDRYARWVTIAARVALVLVVVLTPVVWVLLGRLAASIERGADIAVDSSASVADISRATATLGDDVADLAEAIDAGVLRTDAVLAATIRMGRASDQALSEDLPEALRGLAATARRVAGAGQRVQDIIEALPGDQNLSFGDDLRSLADGLAPLPGTLEDLAPDVGDATAALGQLRLDLADARLELDEAATSLRRVADEIAGLAVEADRAEQELEAVRDRVDAQLWWWRLVLLLTAGTVAALAIGLELLGRAWRTLGPTVT